MTTNITQFGFGDAETWEGKSPDLDDEPTAAGLTIGETFFLKSRQFQVVTELEPTGCSCTGCAFHLDEEDKCCRPDELSLNLSCASNERSDQQSIIFKELL